MNPLVSVIVRTMGRPELARALDSVAAQTHRPIEIVIVDGLLRDPAVRSLDRLLLQAWRSGTVLAGLSAGAMCWFQGGVTRSSGAPEPMAGLGLLEGSLTVHADGEPERLPVWLASVRDGTQENASV